MKNYFKKSGICLFLITVIASGLFAQTLIPKWELSDWGPFAPRDSDAYYVMQYRDKNLSSMPYNTLILDNVPMGNKAKPAIFIKVKDSNYRNWSDYAEPDMHKWDYYQTDNYVVLSFEMSFRSTLEHPLNGTKSGDKLYYRYFLDPQNKKTAELVNNWINLDGPFYVFFLSDSGNMNYYYNYVPKSSKDIAKIAFDEANNALSKMSNRGNFNTSLNTLSRKYPLVEVYSGSDTSKFESNHWGPIIFP
jgi:hypothetical protein